MPGPRGCNHGAAGHPSSRPPDRLMSARSPVMRSNHCSTMLWLAARLLLRRRIAVMTSRGAPSPAASPLQALGAATRDPLQPLTLRPAATNLMAPAPFRHALVRAPAPAARAGALAEQPSPAHATAAPAAPPASTRAIVGTDSVFLGVGNMLTAAQTVSPAQVRGSIVVWRVCAGGGVQCT